jgi:hypothetical protein
MSVFNIDGQFVLRCEQGFVAGSVRDACTAYGYNSITWLDDTTPLH